MFTRGKFLVREVLQRDADHHRIEKHHEVDRSTKASSAAKKDEEDRVDKNRNKVLCEDGIALSDVTKDTIPLIVLSEDSCRVEEVTLCTSPTNLYDSLPLDCISPRFVPSPNIDHEEIISTTEQETVAVNAETTIQLNDESRSESPSILISNGGAGSEENLSSFQFIDETVDEEREQNDFNISLQDPNNFNMNEGRHRKRKADPSQWKRNLNKNLRMEGKPYLGFRKVGSTTIQDTEREERTMKPTCTSSFCEKSMKRNCSQFTDQQRREIHDRFWKLTWGERKTFVSGSVLKVEKQASTGNIGSRRNYTLQYKLNNGCQNYQVCRDMFLNTLGIGYKMVHAWIDGSLHGIPNSNCKEQSTDNRHNEQSNFLTDFFDGLPKMPSHYNRQNSAKLYLEPIFSTIRDVYQIYLEKCQRENQKALGRKKFTEVMNEKNLSLFNVKKDKCNVCSSYETGNISEETWKKHTEKKERARREKQEDIEKAANKDIVLIQMDFQAVKLAPFTMANAFYFKTKLACHDFTIYNPLTKHATCYWFSEDQNNQMIASTFVSCLIDYLERYCIGPEKKPIVIFSDGCTAQNRNNIIANALLNFSMLHDVKITHKYLEVGHTQMEVDSVHACIERKLKNKEIKLPSDYVTLTREARRNPTPYEAIELTFDFFKDYNQNLRYSSIRPGRAKNDPTVTDIRAIHYDSSGIIQVKLNFDDDWINLPQRPKRQPVLNNYPTLFNQKCKITKTKWLHLQELKSVIPQDCHSFYDNLLYQE